MLTTKLLWKIRLVMLSDKSMRTVARRVNNMVTGNSVSRIIRVRGVMANIAITK